MEWIPDDFRAWCKAHGVWADEGAASTHYLMNGGKLHVPADKVAAFHGRVAEAVFHGEKAYVVECHTKVMRLFMDLDLFELPDEAAVDAEALVRAINGVVGSVFGPDVAVVCSARPKQQEKGDDRRKYWKRGMHVVWPATYVTAQQAAFFRERYVLPHLVETFGARPEPNTWEDVVDRCVYDKNGFRMAGCRKSRPCKCRRKERGCGTCDGTGFVDEGRPYMPFIFIDADGTSRPETVARMVDDPREMVRMTHVRTSRREPSRKFEEMADWVQTREKKARSRKQMPKSLRGGDELSEFIAGTRPDGAHVTGVRKLDDTCVVLETDSTHCENIGGAHGSNRVFFVVKRDPFVVYQKCHSERCWGFRGQAVALPEHLKQGLFEGKAQQAKKRPRLEERMRDVIAQGGGDEAAADDAGDVSDFKATLRSMLA